MIDRQTYLIRELAAALRLTPETIRRKARAGEIACIWVGREMRVPREVYVKLVQAGTGRRPKL